MSNGDPTFLDNKIIITLVRIILPSVTGIVLTFGYWSVDRLVKQGDERAVQINMVEKALRDAQEVQKETAEKTTSQFELVKQFLETTRNQRVEDNAQFRAVLTDHESRIRAVERTDQRR